MWLQRVCGEGETEDQAAGEEADLGHEGLGGGHLVVSGLHPGGAGSP